MKTWFAVTVLVFLVSIFFVCVSNRHPSENVIEKEFKLEHPYAEIVRKKLLFEEVAVATYQIEFNENPGSNIFVKQVTLYQCINWDWKIDYRECDKD